MKYEACWILTNLAIASEEKAVTIIDPQYGILETLDGILKESNLKMNEQIFWFVANAAGDSSYIRDEILKRTCVLAVMNQLMIRPNLSLSMIKTIAWANTNICKGRAFSLGDIDKAIQIAALCLKINDE